MMLKMVYLVGWSSKTYTNVFGVFEDIEDAQIYQRAIRRKMCPCGSDYDGSYITTCAFATRWPVEEKEKAEAELDSLQWSPLNCEVAVEAESKCSHP